VGWEATQAEDHNAYCAGGLLIRTSDRVLAMSRRPSTRAGVTSACSERIMYVEWLVNVSPMFRLANMLLTSSAHTGLRHHIICTAVDTSTPPRTFGASTDLQAMQGSVAIVGMWAMPSLPASLCVPMPIYRH
jgi:hypothetical protein